MGAPAIVLLQRSEREIVDHLRRAGATSPDRAVPLPELRHIARRRLRRLVNAQAVRETERGYWLDEPIYEAYRSDRRGLILLLLGIAGAIALGLVVRELV
ncbi:peptidase M20 [Gemmatirosa kalamazoonensis]|uniref:Peptidase M20 n=1 Tax=Gemmatirosa kalamazoonensis TaxID=861299 RepID=W0RLG9_9BACT|nr:hypothetical protein [Gemmatirosa kalamazoonensis]AHG91929.1 peptidase M20 [Gemmatirosa kalamazoonensis]